MTWIVDNAPLLIGGLIIAALATYFVLYLRPWSRED
jgi:lipopolysaccharide export LptBFGC system permease protein LptF